MVNKTQRKIGTEINLGKTVISFDSIGSSSAIDRTASNFLNASKKVQKIKKLFKTGEYNADLIYTWNARDSLSRNARRY